MILSEELARELAYGRIGEEVEGYKVVHNELTDTTRWSTVHLLIIEDAEICPGKFWGTYYCRGATEYQDERPFEDFSEVEFERYRPRPVETVEWLAEEKR